MNDDTTQWVLPAISLGYSVRQDDDGRLCFWNDDVVIVFRQRVWIASDGIDPDRHYGSLMNALQDEYQEPPAYALS